MEKTIVLKPVLSEKAYAVSQTNNTYVFAVPHDANKHSVARAVAAQYEVAVENVNITNVKGKAKRTIRKSGRAVNGRQSDTRKAYVTLKQGDSLPIFAALEEESAEAEQVKKADKVETKNKKDDRIVKNGKDK